MDSDVGELYPLNVKLSQGNWRAVVCRGDHELREQ